MQRDSDRAKEDMENKIKKLQEDIKLNEENQKKQETEIETQRKNLDVLRGKRKGTI